MRNSGAVLESTFHWHRVVISTLRLVVLLSMIFLATVGS